MVRQKRNFGLFSVLAILTAVATTPAQDFMPPDRPPPADYLVQGEYFGTIEGGGDLGAWVVGQGANGGDDYFAVFLPGGLLTIPNQPYGGWNGTTQFTSKGRAATLVPTGAGFTGSIKDSSGTKVMTGKTNTGANFSLKRVVRQSPTLGMAPPATLPAGTTSEYWFRANTQADLANWTPSPTMRYGGNLYRGVTCTKSHGTAYVHVEIRSPYCPTCRDQDRGNSGVYLRGAHEFQVLDSFGNPIHDNELGAIYKVSPPSVNAALPPLTWQTYDIYYTLGTTANTAIATVYLNGVMVQNKTNIPRLTDGASANPFLFLQDHGHDVVYNNIWVVKGATETSLPWNTLVVPVVTIGDKNPPARSKFLNSDPATYDWGNLFDITGRKFEKGRRLSVLPFENSSSHSSH